MNQAESSAVIPSDRNAHTVNKIPSFVYPIYVDPNKGKNSYKDHNESVNDSYLDISLDTSKKLERQSSIISSIDARSNSKRQNDDSFMSYLKSEKSAPKATDTNKIKNVKKAGLTDDQFELVNFVPGAIIKKQVYESQGSPNQSSESINAKNHLNAETANISNKNLVELADSKIIEAKSNLIFDKYIRQFNTSQSKDKEDNNSSYEQIQNMCLPKGLIGSDSLTKDLSSNNIQAQKNPKDKHIDRESYDPKSLATNHTDHLNYNKVNNIHINNYTFQPYATPSTFYPQQNTAIQPIIPQYPYIMPSNSYLTYNYPINNSNKIPYSYQIDNNKNYQVPSFSSGNIIYQTKPQQHPYNGGFIPPNQAIINNNNYSNTKQLNTEKLKNDISLNIVKAVRDQNECRNLQIQLDKDPALSHKILPQLLHYFVLFCSDPFGNYLVQKILTCLFDEEFDRIVFKILEHFNDLSTHNFGTRVIQKLIEIGGQQHLNKLIPSIRENLYSLYKNQNGIHVILKFMAKCKNNQFIFDFIQSNIALVSKNKDGCCMVQKILEGSITEQKVSFKII